jgi:hypothetical protein
LKDGSYVVVDVVPYIVKRNDATDPDHPKPYDLLHEIKYKEDAICPFGSYKS